MSGLSLKDKHRGRVWLDVDSDIWFVNVDTDEWNVLSFYSTGEAQVVAHENPDSMYGPYRQLKLR